MPLSERDHLFTRLGEECAEVVQRVTKLLTYGIDEKQEGQEFTNRERLSHEMIDLITVFHLLILRGDVAEPGLTDGPARSVAKVEKIKFYMDYAEQKGELIRDHKTIWEAP